MSRLGIVLGLSALAACGTLLEDGPDGDPLDGGGGASDSGDAAAESGEGCDPSKPFGAPVPLAFQSPDHVLGTSPRLSDDETEIFFASDEEYGVDQFALYTARRASIAAPFGPRHEIAVLDHDRLPGEMLLSPSPAPGGSSLYYVTNVTGEHRIHVAPRFSDGGFGTGQVVAGLATFGLSHATVFAAAGGELFLSARFATDAGVRPSLHLWKDAGPPQELLAPLGDDGDDAPVPSSDALTLYYAKRPAVSLASGDVHVATRASPSVPFERRGPIDTVNISEEDSPGWLSTDGCRLYSSNGSVGPEKRRLHVATRGR